MNLFDILGPVMVGPSSSHTAGAVRIGWMTQKLLGEQPVEAKILMYGSFAATGKGHGTDRGLVAGLLGMRPDDERIPDSFEIARKMGLSYSFGIANLTSAHPNSVVLEVKGKSGRTLEVQACSLGGRPYHDQPPRRAGCQLQLRDSDPDRPQSGPAGPRSRVTSMLHISQSTLRICPSTATREADRPSWSWRWISRFPKSRWNGWSILRAL